MTKESGQPKLSDSQFRRYMNIIYLSGVIGGIDRSRKHFEGTEDAHRLDMEHYLTKRELTDLTGNLPPKTLLEEMYRMGKDTF